MTVKIINRSSNPLPSYATPQSAGVDLRACLPSPVTLQPLQRAVIPTGLYMQIPSGCEGQIRPRSGLAAKHGITVLNTPGTIDSDYRGEIRVLLINLSGEPFEIADGDRIAQMVFARHEQAGFEDADILDDSSRGEGGFGSTGTR